MERASKAYIGIFGIGVTRQVKRDKCRAIVNDFTVLHVWRKKGIYATVTASKAKGGIFGIGVT